MADSGELTLGAWALFARPTIRADIFAIIYHETCFDALEGSSFGFCVSLLVDSAIDSRLTLGLWPPLVASDVEGR